jgi:predicted transcriptional regulator
MKRGRPPGRKLSNSVTFRVDEDAMTVLSRLAEEEQRPIAMMARILLNEALAAREGKPEAPPGRKRKGKAS